MSDKAKVVERVKTFEKKKSALAVASLEEGHGSIRVNGSPIQLVEVAGLRTKLYEAILDSYFVVGKRDLRILTFV